MPEVLIDPLSIAGSGSFSGVATRVLSTASPIGSQSNVSPVAFRIIKYVNASPVSASVTAVLSTHKFKTVKGALLSEGLLETYTYDRDIRNSMRDYLPRYYDDLEDVMKIIEAEANEVTRIQAKLNEALDQFYVNSATFGLDRWENEVGITKIEARSVDSRRHFINAKLRGVGTVTRVLLKEIVDAFYTSSITEIPTENKVDITLLGKRGIPKNLEDIERSVNDVIPSQLEAGYLFTYLPWSEVDASGIIWTEADTYTHKGLEEAFLVEPDYPYQN